MSLCIGEEIFQSLLNNGKGPQGVEMLINKLRVTKIATPRENNVRRLKFAQLTSVGLINKGLELGKKA